MQNSVSARSLHEHYDGNIGTVFSHRVKAEIFVLQRGSFGPKIEIGSCGRRLSFCVTSNWTEGTGCRNRERIRQDGWKDLYSDVHSSTTAGLLICDKALTRPECSRALTV